MHNHTKTKQYKKKHDIKEIPLPQLKPNIVCNVLLKVEKVNKKTHEEPH